MAVKKASSRSTNKVVHIDQKNFISAMDEFRDLVNLFEVLQKEYKFTKKDAAATRKKLEKAVKFLQNGMK